MPVVNLPPGCSGLQMTDGTNYTGKPGGRVNVADEHAPFVRRQVGGDAGLVGHGSFRTFLGTKAGRWCVPCRRLWQSWSAQCPRCGEDTLPEAEMPSRGPSVTPSACPVPFPVNG
jgi:hypothetical protein